MHEAAAKHSDLVKTLQGLITSMEDLRRGMEAAMKAGFESMQVKHQPDTPPTAPTSFQSALKEDAQHLHPASVVTMQEKESEGASLQLHEGVQDPESEGGEPDEGPEEDLAQELPHDAAEHIAQILAGNDLTQVPLEIVRRGLEVKLEVAVGALDAHTEKINELIAAEIDRIPGPTPMESWEEVKKKSRQRPRRGR